MRRWFREVWNEGKTQTIYDLMDENGIAVGRDQPGVVIRGPRGFEKFVNKIRGAFPDLKITLEDAFGADDKVVIRWSATMTHTGEGLDIAPTGKPVKVTGISIAQIENGKIVRGWDNWDQLAMQQQLALAAAAHT